MSVTNKNISLGAGDGIRNTINKRTPVASSRRFATRGISKNITVRQKLQEALESFSTPPQSPLKVLRSKSVVELTPSKKLQAEGTPVKSKLEVHECPSRKDDAGRRVCHQLLLHAWRRRRRQVAELTQSCDRFQTQVGQMQIQIDVLQKLRENEGTRRTEANNECSSFKIKIEEMERDQLKLKQIIAMKEAGEVALHQTIENLKVDLRNEQNNLNTMTNHRLTYEQAYNRERHVLQTCREERHTLSSKVSELETTLKEEKEKYTQLEDLVKVADTKYTECFKQFQQLELKYDKQDGLILNEKQLNVELDNLLIESKHKHEKLESKLCELKRILANTKQRKRVVTDKYEILKCSYEEMEKCVKEETEKQWWKCTGEFMVHSMENLAYLLFPALPPPTTPTRLALLSKYAMGLGTEH